MNRKTGAHKEILLSDCRCNRLYEEKKTTNNKTYMTIDFDSIMVNLVIVMLIWLNVNFDCLHGFPETHWTFPGACIPGTWAWRHTWRHSFHLFHNSDFVALCDFFLSLVAAGMFELWCDHRHQQRWRSVTRQSLGWADSALFPQSHFQLSLVDFLTVAAVQSLSFHKAWFSGKGHLDFSQQGALWFCVCRYFVKTAPGNRKCIVSVRVRACVRACAKS